jgi:hypothetical protein
VRARECALRKPVTCDRLYCACGAVAPYAELNGMCCYQIVTPLIVRSFGSLVSCHSGGLSHAEDVNCVTFRIKEQLCVWCCEQPLLA